MIDPLEKGNSTTGDLSYDPPPEFQEFSGEESLEITYTSEVLDENESVVVTFQIGGDVNPRTLQIKYGYTDEYSFNPVMLLYYDREDRFPQVMRVIHIYCDSHEEISLGSSGYTTIVGTAEVNKIELEEMPALILDAATLIQWDLFAIVNTPGYDPFNTVRFSEIFQTKRLVSRADEDTTNLCKGLFDNMFQNLYLHVNNQR
jgi:hypothetical protein